MKIEVLDYHAEPLVLTPEVLGEFGLVFREAPTGKTGRGKSGGRSREVPARPEDRKKGDRSILATSQREQPCPVECDFDPKKRIVIAQ